MRFTKIAISLSIILFFRGISFGAQTIEEEDRLIEEEKIQELKKIKIAPPKIWEKISFRFGGWFNIIFRDYKDIDNDSAAEDKISSSLLEDLRLWTKISFFRRYSLYVRIKNAYIRRSTGLGYTGIGDDYEGPRIDMGYFDLNFKRFQLKAGRQHIYVGRGIVYGKVHDGIKFVFLSPKTYSKIFFTKTQPDEENIDISVPNYKKEGKRLFLGGEFSYLGMPNWVFYLYTLIQRDKGVPYPEGPSQSYLYDSEYYGLGFEAKPRENLRYWLEIIREKGESFTDAQAVSLEKKSIDAWALDLGIRYKFKTFLSPHLEFEYAFGSGDKDRTSVTDTKDGGNRYGEDENFLYFGNFFSGYASSLRLSNLHIWKIDLGIRPLEKSPLFKDISLGAKFFLYRKHKRAGGIYDSDATETNDDVGKELNFYFYWRLNPYMYISLRYGIFFAGKAYPESTNDSTKYFYSSVTFRF